jgi:nucleoside-diphosphate-sugar epimerase
MKIAVTGASGFIGEHVVRALLARGHAVTAAARDEQKARSRDWFARVRFVTMELASAGPDAFEALGRPDVLVHLAWSGLPRYKERHHLDQVPAHYLFLRGLIDAGLRHLLVAGTCFEYGMQSGCLSEDMAAAPANPYAVAKDSLRRLLEARTTASSTTLQWARLFYTYGPGQSPTSLLSQLDKAIADGDKVFNMSGGEQLRDYLPIETVAASLARLAETSGEGGIINICSGQPVSVRRLVEEHLRRRGAQMHLNLGHYPYPDYEPMAFWGKAATLHRIISE